MGMQCLLYIVLVCIWILWEIPWQKITGSRVLNIFKMNNLQCHQTTIRSKSKAFDSLIKKSNTWRDLSCSGTRKFSIATLRTKSALPTLNQNFMATKVWKGLCMGQMTLTLKCIWRVKSLLGNRQEDSILWQWRWEATLSRQCVELGHIWPRTVAEKTAWNTPKCTVSTCCHPQLESEQGLNHLERSALPCIKKRQTAPSSLLMWTFL